MTTTLQEKLLNFVREIAENPAYENTSNLQSQAYDLLQQAEEGITVIRLLTYSGTKASVENMLARRSVKVATTQPIMGDSVTIREQFIAEPIEAYSACVEVLPQPVKQST